MMLYRRKNIARLQNCPEITMFTSQIGQIGSGWAGWGDDGLDGQAPGQRPVVWILKPNSFTKQGLEEQV